MRSTTPARAVAGRTWPFLAPVILVLVVVGLGTLGTLAQQRTVTLMLINLIIVVGLQIFVGNSGILSFGHASFMAIGAYTTALLTIPLSVKAFQLPDLPDWLADAHVSTELGVLLPAVLAGAVGLVVGLPIMRLSGLSASIVTFSLLVVSFTVTNYWTKVTAGPSVLGGMPFDVTLPRATVWALIAMTIAYLYKFSRRGLKLRATREEETAANGCAINAPRERVIAFALSGFVVAIGGALLAHVQGSVAPSTFYLAPTFEMLIMLVVGGIRSYAGAVVGTIVVSALQEVLRTIEQGITLGPLVFPARPNLRELVLGAILILVLVLRPEGIMGSKEIQWPISKWCARSRMVNISSLIAARWSPQRVRRMKQNV